MSEEIPEWIKLPVNLQHEFFKLAEKEAQEIIGIIKEIDSNLKIIRDKVLPHIKPVPDQEKMSIIAAVDGSRSPKLSERLGVRYGVFTYGAVYLQGRERMDERLEARVFKARQGISRAECRYVFPLLMTYFERKMALEALEKCNLLFIDGSFYSFIYPALDMKKRGFLEGREHIIKEIFSITEKLRESRKVLGVIKRSQTKALGGYLVLEIGENPFITILDKHILSLLMPQRTFFEYRSILGEKSTTIYTGIARLARKMEVNDPQRLIKEAEEKAYKPLETLKLSKEGFMEMRRAHIRFYDGLPPCEIEYPSTLDIREVLAERNLFSEVTNLPVTVDLIDNLTNISSKFTEEFVSEIEGRVLEALAKNGESLNSIKSFFSFLNPQKPF